MNISIVSSTSVSAYKSVQSTLPPKPWFSNFGTFSRRNFMSICRLRFHQNRLPENLTYFPPDIPPYCPLHSHSHTLATSSFITLKNSSSLPEHLDRRAYHPFWPARTLSYILQLSNSYSDFLLTCQFTI